MENRTSIGMPACTQTIWSDGCVAAVVRVDSLEPTWVDRRQCYSCLGDWLRVPVDHLKSHLSKVDTGAIKACCDLYLSPNCTPKLKTGRYGIIVERFRSRSLFLFHAPDVEVLKSYLALAPYNPPTPEASRRELVKRILRGEFGHGISDQLLLPTSSERQNEKMKEIRRSNWKCTVADVRANRDEYIHSWPQLVPKDVLTGCLNTYYEATQLQIPLICCVCSRQRFDVEIREIALSAGADLPDYLSTLKAMPPSLYQQVGAKHPSHLPFLLCKGNLF